MREIILNTGGRKLHNIDEIELQKHITAIQSIFAKESPFVISGVEFTALSNGNYDISSGFIWLGGKIRLFAGSKNLSLSADRFINTSNTFKKTIFNDGIVRNSKVQYGVVMSTIGAGGSNQLQINVPANIKRYGDINENLFVSTEPNRNQIITSEVDFIGASEFISTLVVSGGFTINGTLDIDEPLSVDELILSGTNNVVSGDLTSDGKIGGSSYELSYSIGTDAIDTNGNIGDNLVETDSILNGSVTEEKILSNSSIGFSKLQANSITTEKIADGSIIAYQKITTNAITAEKLALGGVDTDNFNDGSVTSNKIVDGSVTEPKLGFANLELVGMGYIPNHIPRANIHYGFKINHNLGLSSPNNYFYRVRVLGGNNSFICDTTSDVESNSFRFQTLFENADPYASDAIALQWIIYKINIR